MGGKILTARGRGHEDDLGPVAQGGVESFEEVDVPSVHEDGQVPADDPVVAEVSAAFLVRFLGDLGGQGPHGGVVVELHVVLAPYDLYKVGEDPDGDLHHTSLAVT